MQLVTLQPGAAPDVGPVPHCACHHNVRRADHDQNGMAGEIDIGWQRRKPLPRRGGGFYNFTLTPATTVGPDVCYPFTGSNFESKMFVPFA